MQIHRISRKYNSNITETMQQFIFVGEFYMRQIFSLIIIPVEFDFVSTTLTSSGTSGPTMDNNMTS